MSVCLPQSDPMTEAILKHRAEKLANYRESIDNSAKTTMVEFRIANERYALSLSEIRIIHPLTQLTYIPGTPDFIKGVINLRGEIISVVDLKIFFDLPEQQFTNLTQVIILTSEHMEFGILADEILGLTEIEEKNIQPSLPTLTGIREDFLKGVTGDGRVILDEKKLLNDKKMCINL